MQTRPNRSIPQLICFIAIAQSIATFSLHGSEATEAPNSPAQLLAGGHEWIALDDNSTRFVLADYAIEDGLDYRAGGWIEVEGQSFFLPHDLPTEQYQAIQNGLFNIPPKSNSKTAKVLQTVSRVTAKTILVSAAGLATQGYMGNEGVFAISDFVDEVIHFAEQ